MSKNQIPDHLLQHLEYLRGLHLEGPRVGNTYLEDSALRSYLEDYEISKNQAYKKQLERLGDRFCTIYAQAARNAQQNHPRLEQFDTYGRRIDKLHLSQGWKALGKYSAEDGIVQMAYQQDKFQLKQNQRFGQLVALYMYQPYSGLYACPLAMTDGAAYTLRNMDRSNRPELEQAYQRLTSRKNPWTSGQWMTQKKGGSDVSNTQTLAIKSDGNKYNLYGYKWFTSATESQMSLGLAKIIKGDQIPSQQQLSKIPVSLFFIKVHNDNSQLNRMEIIRLKDKLGTQQLPTAELLLKGSEAYLMSAEGKGVKTIAKMLTVTRIYNSSSAVGGMRKMIGLLRDYSSRRIIGKKRLADLPLQKRILSHLQVTHRGNLIFFLNISHLFSKEHAGTISSDEANIVRVMTPILKLFTAKQAIEVSSEVVEGFGGMGYIQSSLLPTAWRDTQVLSIWQGTTNVLCHDFVRALLSNKESLNSIIKFFVTSFEQIMTAQVRDQTFISSNKQIVNDYLLLIKELENQLKVQFRTHAAELRNYCFGLARIYIAVLLQLRALNSMRKMDIQISNRWTKRGLFNLQNYEHKMDNQIGLDLDDINEPRGVGDKDSRGKIRPRL